MKISFSKLSLLLFVTLAATALAIHPFPKIVSSKNDVVRVADDDLHRKLMSDPNECQTDFVCPLNSERIYGKQCYDSFDDCVCLAGYYKNSENTDCVAKEGLCTLEYIDMVAGELVEIESWIDMAESPDNTPEKRYAAIESINLYYPEMWNDYNDAKASCEMYVFGDEDNRRLFGRRIRNTLRSVGERIKKVAKTVVKTIVSTVDLLVNAVVQIVECGVGVATDGARCGLIGCAFGLGGAAIDIAFTVASGGSNRVATLQCALQGNNDLLVLLEGIGSIICAVDELVDSPVLRQACATAEAVGDGIVEIPATVEFFLETFHGAICGNPGSSIANLLEEVVSCEIGCAEDDNVFCPRNGPVPAPTLPPTPIPAIPTAPVPAPTLPPAPVPAPTLPPPVAPPTLPLAPVAPPTSPLPPVAAPTLATAPVSASFPASPPGPKVTEYYHHAGKACRTKNGKQGKKDVHFIALEQSEFENCEATCSGTDRCKAFETNDNLKRCEIWIKEPVQFASSAGFNCYVKL